MNLAAAENDFLVGLKRLLADLDQFRDPQAPPFAGAHAQKPHEHATRVDLLDRIVELLGWQLGLGGNVVEEARIKDGSTTFIDYLGISDEAKLPVLLIEAKAWGKPFADAGVPRTALTGDADFVAASIRHLREGGTPADNPGGSEWHAYVRQLEGYIRRLKTVYQHELPRAVITSGEWLVVFMKPLETFVEGECSVADIAVFRIAEYVKQGDKLFAMLGRHALAPQVPYPLRLTQLPTYFGQGNDVRVFHSAHVRYDQLGTELFGPKPKISIYPALTLIRQDNVLVTVFEDHPLTFDYDALTNGGPPNFAEHLAAMDLAAADLLQRCSVALGVQLVPRPLDQFPGFPQAAVAGLGQPARKMYVRRDRPDTWLLVTGVHKHFVANAPLVEDCRFHVWAECSAAGVAIGDAAVAVRRTTNPRAFFVDGNPHYCGHAGLDDKREQRCQIRPIEQHLCCQTCVYADACWSAADKAELPCGT